jgi:hypothetical protein
MKSLFRIFELSKNEQRVVLLIMLILITIALVLYGRRVHHSFGALATQPKPSPTVVEAVSDQ